MFEQYPKKRPQLLPAYLELYERYYLLNRQGNSKATSLASKMETWMHRQVSQNMLITGTNSSSLEIGAGTLNHLAYVPANHAYDIIEPFTVLYQDAADLSRIRNIYQNISQLPTSLQYNNIISIAVLEHLEDLPAQVAMAALHLAPGGRFLAAIPNEGTFLWWLGWNITTGLEFRIRYSLNYKLMMRHEHINTAREIDEVLHYFFDDVKCKVLGLSKELAFYRFYRCTKPLQHRCNDYLNTIIP